jgi:hypothetical protein
MLLLAANKLIMMKLSCPLARLLLSLAIDPTEELNLVLEKKKKKKRK